jgi:flagellin-specific chaperone FliS
MVNKSQSVDSTIQAIEAIISRLRSSLTDDEINTLQQCIDSLNAFKANDYQDLERLSQVIDVIFKVLTGIEGIKDLF